MQSQGILQSSRVELPPLDPNDLMRAKKKKKKKKRPVPLYDEPTDPKHHLDEISGIVD